MRKLWPVLMVVAMGAACSRPPAADPQLVKRVSQLETENVQLRAKLGEAEAAHPQPATQPSGASPGKQRSRPAQDPRPDVAGYDAIQNELRSLRSRAEESREMVAGLEARRDELQAQLDAIGHENKRLTATEAEMKEKLADAARRIDKLQADLKTQQELTAQMEAANGRLRQANSSAQQASGLAGELQDLSRRRQQYIESILRRYSELTEHYRTLSSRFESRREGDAAIANGAEASRIQSTLAAVEEDVRQLNSLSARMQLVQKRMGVPAAKAP